MTPKIVLAFFPILAGSVFAMRILKLRHPLFYLPVGMGLGWTVALMLADLILKTGLSFEPGLFLTFGTLGIAGIVGLRGISKIPPEKLEIGWLGWSYLLLGTGVIWFSSVTILLLNPDGDYWIHAPMQGQMLLGNFPPQNPYFSEIPYGGHYARDFLGVLVSWCADASPFATQIPVAALLQLAAFYILFLAGYRYAGGSLAGALLSLYVFTGVNAGLRQGWLDTLANNTCLANMHTALLLFLLVRCLFEKVGWGEVVTTAVLFAGLAWSYETNFVSLSLGLVTLALFTAAKGKLTKHHLKVSACLVSVALVVLVAQGGSMGHLITDKLAGKSATSGPVNEVLQAQNQKVSVSFPKEKFLQINVVRPGEDLSVAYLTVPWAKNLGLEFEELGYVSILSPKVWRIHWLAFYLSPLTLIVLWRRFNPLGLAFFSYGLASYLLPAVVDFGIFEVEVFRWQFATSWGFAGALGVALALWFDSVGTVLGRVKDDCIVVGKKELALGSIILITYFNSYPSWSQFQRRTSVLPSQQAGWRLPSAREWLFFHPILGMNDADLEVNQWLFEQANPGDEFLTNFRERNYDNMMEENTLIGLSGVMPIGHSLPLQYEPVGTPPFRRNALARAYWATGDQELLRNRPPRWLYHRSDSPGAIPEQTAELKLVKQADSALGSGRLFEVSLEPYQLFPFTDSPSQFKAVGLELPDRLLPEQYQQAQIRLMNKSDTPVSGRRLLSYRFAEQPNEEGLSQMVTLELEPKEEQTLPLHFVTPHHSGTFEVQVLLDHKSDQREIGRFTIIVENGPDLGDLKVRWAEDNPALVQGEIAQVRLALENTGQDSVIFEGLASLTLDTGERPPKPDDYQPVAFSLKPGERSHLQLMLVAPTDSGAWPLSLRLGARTVVGAFDLESVFVNPRLEKEAI